MGDEGPDVWADEFRRTGRVEFPVRRRPVLIRLAVVVLFIGGSQMSSLIELPDAGTTEVILRLLSFSGVLVVVGFFVWQLITRRPVLTVDHEGIRLGRKRFMPWTNIGTIAEPAGPSFYRNIPVLPADVWSKDLRLPQDNVRDIPALTTWLTNLHKAHRNSPQP
jgi:hypothetical protein